MLVGDDLWIDYGVGGVYFMKFMKVILDCVFGVLGMVCNLWMICMLIELMV